MTKAGRTQWKTTRFWATTTKQWKTVHESYNLWNIRL